MSETSTAAPVVIKKYANRRLYNTATSSYVTLDHLSDLVKQGVDFVVYDAKTNDDITRQVLGQIIFELEGRGQNLLPPQFLRQLIRFYGDSMQSFLPRYLEMSLATSARQGDAMRAQGAGAPPGLNFFEEQARQNMALFDQAMRMFTPFAYAKPDAAAKAEPAAEEPAPNEVEQLRRQLEAMQAQIDKLAKPDG